MADKAQVRTQQAGLRPMGVVSTFIGMDQLDEDGSLVPQIWMVDPAGFYCGYHGFAVGKKQAEANAALEKHQKVAAFDTLTEKEAAMIALSALQSAIGSSVKATEVEVGRCSVTHPSFERVPDAEVEEWLTAVAEAD
ncbi:20S proteasome subunit alpha 1 [Angomonas deanei]|nr:20S proteasome subunit alpha 1 [Angomonas deanei]|eukprot:EPY36360.1 20S proteasome subunit alpha 1 [Angomonas deanei]